VQVVNTTRDTDTNATVEAIAYDVNAKVGYSHPFTGLTIEAKKTTIIGEIPLFKSNNNQPEVVAQ
jgi:hypothetical protein